MKSPVLLCAILALLAGPGAWGQAKKSAGGAKGRIAVLERLDQNVGRAVEGITLNDKQKASIDKDRQALRQASSARREGLNEDKKATGKALKDLEKTFKDKKLAFDSSLRQTVQEDVTKLLADARNEPRRNTRVPRSPSPNPFPRTNPRRVPRW